MDDFIFRYGILVKWRRIDEEEVWRIMTIGPTVRDSFPVIISERNVFDFSPRLGDSVKIKMKRNDEYEEPIAVTRESQWIRDVQVFDETVVVFAFVYFDAQSLQTTFVSYDDNREYYVFKNELGDFPETAIPKSNVDATLQKRSIYQRENEKIIYRVGLQCKRLSLNSSISMKQPQNPPKVRWCHYEDTQMVPILERYSRESTVPFIDETLVYGAIDGIVIAQNDFNSLIWTPSMGCLHMSSTAFSRLCPIGEILWVPPRRCLAETSFNFPCHYEMFHDSKNHIWQNLNVIVDHHNKEVYIEAEAEVVRLKEDNSKLGILVPNIGIVLNGIEKYRNSLECGMQISVRLCFEQLNENEPFEIVAKEIILMTLDPVLECRIVRSSLKLQKCWAIIDPYVKANSAYRDMVEFIEIPSRVLWCSKKVRLDDSSLGSVRMHIRISRPTSKYSLCYALNIVHISRPIGKSMYHEDFRFISGCGWFICKLAEIVHVPNDRKYPIILMTDRDKQLILDPLRYCESRKLLQYKKVAVNAQCVLRPGNVPTFVMRHVELELRNLPSINELVIQRLPGIRELFSIEMPETNLFIQQESNNFTNNALIYENMEMKRHNLFWNQKSSTYPGNNFCKAMMSSVTYPTIVSEEQNRHTVPKDAYFASTPFSPSRGSGNQQCSREIKGLQELRRADLRLGIRHWNGRSKSYEELLYEIVYQNLKYRPMFTDDQRKVLASWKRDMRGDIMKIKHKRVSVIGVERVDTHESYRTKRCEYESLVRLYVRSTEIVVKEQMVVIPVGGHYPPLPESFLLGSMYSTTHLSSSAEEMPRIIGYGRNIGTPHFSPEVTNPYKNHTIMSDGNGRQWIQIAVICNRPTQPKLQNEVFELWNCLDISGLVIAEVGNMTLESLDSENYESYEMSCMIEPVAGGPFSIKEIVDNDQLVDQFFSSEEYLIMWKVVTDSGEHGKKYKPHCVKKQCYRAKEEPLYDCPGLRISLGEGQNETIRFAQELTELRIDRLRKMGDYRVRQREGPDLAPQLEARKISIPERREVMLETFHFLKKSLRCAHDHGLWLHLTYEMLSKQIREYELMNDNQHEFNMTKRRRSLHHGCNFLMDMVADEDIVVDMHLNCGENVLSILERIASCLSLNRTFLKKTEQMKKLFTYCYQNKLMTLE